MQSWPLDRKILLSETLINEWYTVNEGNVYVSFSGGKDSTVLLHLVRKLHPDVPAVFIDTGLEYPEIREFVKTIPNVVWIKPAMNFKKVIETYGYPLISKEVSGKIYEARSKPDGSAARRFDPNGEYATKYDGRYSMVRWRWLLESDVPISNRCCNVMKKNPAKKYERETGRKPFIGSLACESPLRKSEWIKHGCNSFDAYRPSSKPLSVWMDRDILEYIKRFEVPYCCVYGDIIGLNENGDIVDTGSCDCVNLKTTLCDRTGCVFCGFGAHLEKEPNRFQRLKVTHPVLWNYCMKPWEKGGLGMKEILEFVKVKIE